MTTTLTPERLATDTADLTAALERAAIAYPGDPTVRQPVHTVYGGAQLYKATSTRRMGELALATLDTYAPDAASLAAALGWTGRQADLAGTIYDRVVAKLRTEAVEDFRIDFEDGFGYRPDDEEDAAARRTATELAAAMRDGIAPPFIGIRVKPFSGELYRRGIRTLDIFLTTLVAETGGALPDGFVITLPKVTMPEQVTTLDTVLTSLESDLGLAGGSVPIELMVETPQSIIGADGTMVLASFVDAAGGRCRGLHFGTYDYTALCNITAAYQDMAHGVCDFAKHVMQVTSAQRGLMISDGATNVMPVGPHRAPANGELTVDQLSENANVVHAAWRLQHSHVRHSLEGGFYQGWDLHPAQLPVRYATVFAFFLDGMEQASLRLKTFVDQAAQATLVGDVFDDAATGQGLLNFFLRAINSGAATLDDLAATGLDEADLATRSFPAILARRARR